MTARQPREEVWFRRCLHIPMTVSYTDTQDNQIDIPTESPTLFISWASDRNEYSLASITAKQRRLDLAETQHTDGQEATALLFQA